MEDIYLKYLICPQCQNDFIFIPSNISAGPDVREGVLQCRTCSRIYPITLGIPDLLISRDFFDNDDLNSKVKKANLLFYDYFAPNYENDISTYDFNKKYTRSRIKETLKFIKDNSDGKFLVDFACGTGNILSLAQEYFQHFLGFDISLAMLQIARAKNLPVFRSDIENIPIKSNTADCITCYSVLHHIYNPLKIFSEAYRIMKKGAYFYSDYDPNHSSKIIQGSRIYQTAKNIFQKIQSNNVSFTTNTSIESYKILSEYYHNYEKGFDPLKLREDLLEVGFKNISIIEHSNCYSLGHNSFLHIPLISKIEMTLKFLLTFRFNYNFLASHLLIIAQK